MAKLWFVSGVTIKSKLQAAPPWDSGSKIQKLNLDFKKEKLHLHLFSQHDHIQLVIP